MKNKLQEKKILDFFAEAGLLKRVKRSGWWVLGIKNPESVAEHSFRCAVIGYVLAKMENVEPYHVLLMTLFGDIHEARVNDLHKLGHRYIDFRLAEDKVFKDQMDNLIPSVKNELTMVRGEYSKQKTKASVIARDADILECLVQAKEYYDSGIKEASKFFKKAPGHLKTKSAIKLWKFLKTWHCNDWWKDLCVFER